MFLVKSNRFVVNSMMSFIQCHLAAMQENSYNRDLESFLGMFKDGDVRFYVIVMQEEYP